MKFLITALLFFSSHVSALDGTYVRLNGDTVISFKSSGDFRWTLTEGKREFVDQGVYEEATCSQGNYMFYISDGTSCCMSVREVGSKFLMEKSSGLAVRVCRGGVFQRDNTQ